VLKISYRAFAIAEQAEPAMPGGTPNSLSDRRLHPGVRDGNLVVVDEDGVILVGHGR
jgi:hypothetical protein